MLGPYCHDRASLELMGEERDVGRLSSSLLTRGWTNGWMDVADSPLLSSVL